MTSHQFVLWFCLKKYIGALKGCFSCVGWVYFLFRNFHTAVRIHLRRKSSLTLDLAHDALVDHPDWSLNSEITLNMDTVLQPIDHHFFLPPDPCSLSHVFLSAVVLTHYWRGMDGYCFLCHQQWSRRDRWCCFGDYTVKLFLLWKCCTEWQWQKNDDRLMDKLRENYDRE